MDNLKRIIGNNKVIFSSEVMADGDEKRFFDRLDKDGCLRNNISVISKRPRMWKIAPVLVAAVTLLFLMVNTFVISTWDADDDILQIYSKYIVEMVNISVDIENNIVMDNSQEQNINAITFEARPLMDILPEEMSKEDKIRVMTDYYSKKLAGVERLRERLLVYN